MSTPKLPNLDLFGDPDINLSSPNKTTVKEKKPKHAVTKTAKEDKPVTKAQVAAPKKVVPVEVERNINQAFLPGLSRRGRPRSKDPITAVERTAKHRRERLDAGAKRVEVILAPEVTRKLEALAQQQQEPKSEVISTLINKAFARMTKAKPTSVPAASESATSISTTSDTTPDQA